MVIANNFNNFNGGDGGGGGGGGVGALTVAAAAGSGKLATNLYDVQWSAAEQAVLEAGARGGRERGG